MPNNNTFALAVNSDSEGASSTAEFQFTKGADPMVVRIQPDHFQGSGMFLVRAAGRATTGATGDLTIRLDAGTSATIANNTTIFASTARELATEDASWFIEAICYVDRTSDKLQGYGRAMINDLYDVEAALTEVTGFDLDAEQGFTVTGQFEVSNAGNSAVCEFFEIQQL